MQLAVIVEDMENGMMINYINDGDSTSPRNNNHLYNFVKSKNLLIEQSIKKFYTKIGLRCINTK